LETFQSPLIDKLLGEPSTSMPMPAPMRGRRAPFDFPSAHLIGIGGCGMSSIALAMLACGVRVSGSDAKAGASVRRLREAGANVAIGHAEENLGDAAVVVVSTAIPESNPELVAARARGIQIVHRSDALAMFLAKRSSVLIAGTHGKTTTTSMAGVALAAGGLDPWAFVGGYVPAFGGNTRVGGLRYAVAEADESDGTFERLPGGHLVVTNIENDHLDYWKTPARMRAGYRRVMEAIPDDGVVLLCEDDAGVREVRRKVKRPVLTWGLNSEDTHFSAANLVRHPFSTEFDFFIRREKLGRFEVGVPGIHNVSNAVAALALTVELGGDAVRAGEALRGFHGVGRRFEVKGTAAGTTVIDDYAHHPSEIQATLSAARALRDQTGGRLVAIFQPHRYTRTRDLMDEFAGCFGDADVLVLTSVYAAGEKPLPRAGGDLLFRRARRAGHPNARFVANRADIAARVAPELRPGDVVLTLGAGDNHLTGDEILGLLRNDSPANGAP